MLFGDHPQDRLLTADQLTFLSNAASDASCMDMYEQLCIHGKENVTLGVPMCECH